MESSNQHSWSRDQDELWVSKMRINKHVQILWSYGGMARVCLLNLRKSSNQEFWNDMFQQLRMTFTDLIQSWNCFYVWIRFALFHYIWQLLWVHTVQQLLLGNQTHVIWSCYLQRSVWVRDQERNTQCGGKYVYGKTFPNWMNADTTSEWLQEAIYRSTTHLPRFPMMPAQYSQP